MPDEDVKLESTPHKYVDIERERFIQLLHYCGDQKLFDKFDAYLKEQGMEKISISGDFANHLKKFFLRERLVRDLAPRNAILCSCGGSPAY